MVFKSLSDKKVIGNLNQYILKYILKNPNTEVYVGTDSQNSKTSTIFVTCIALRSGTRGSHILYSMDRNPKIKDRFNRLYSEGIKSVETASKLHSNGIAIKRVEFDYNCKAEFFSHKLVSALTGYASSMGFKSTTKPDEQVAVKAANHICNNP